MKNRVIHGARYTIHGMVIRGQGIGKKHDLPPTMNIEVVAMPTEVAYGIYAVRVRRTDAAVQGPPVGSGPHDSGWLPGVAHYGPRPAVNAPLSFEVHLFDFSEEWYGAQVEVEIMDFIRPVENFDRIQELKEQIENDIRAARKIHRIAK